MSSSKTHIPSTALRALVSSSLKRQNLTATVPAAARFLPLGALVAGELLERHVGSSVVKDMLVEKDQPNAVIALGDAVSYEQSLGPRLDFGIMSCASCSPVHKSLLSGDRTVLVGAKSAGFLAFAGQRPLAGQSRGCAETVPMD